MTSPYPGICQTAIECLKLLSDKDNQGLGMFAPLVKHVLQCEVEIESDQEYLKQVKIAQGTWVRKKYTCTCVMPTCLFILILTVFLEF